MNPLKVKVPAIVREPFVPGPGEPTWQGQGRVRISEEARRKYRNAPEYGFIAGFQWHTLPGMHPENRILVRWGNVHQEYIETKYLAASILTR